MRRDKQIQISEVLFMQMYEYFVCGKADNFNAIVDGINQKIEKSIDHELYTQSKIAATPEERDKARLDYLRRRGVPESLVDSRPEHLRKQDECQRI